MDLNNKRKKCVRIDRNTRSEENFALLDEVNSDQEKDTENLMNDSDTEFIVDENLDNDIDSDDEPLSVLIPEANIHVVKSSTAEANMEESNVVCEKESKQKSKRKGKEKATKKKSVDFNWKKRPDSKLKQPCALEAEVTIDPLPEHRTPFDIFSAVTDIENLIKLIVVESNLYAQQKGREFQTNEQEMRAFLGINYVMSINKLPTIKSYWECGQYVGNEGIRNIMSRSRFEDILQNLHFSDNTKDDKSDKGYKVRSLINHFNQSFSECVSGDCTQSIDETHGHIYRTVKYETICEEQTH